MKIKCRWYRIEPFGQPEYKKLVQSLKKHAFNDERSVGYIIDVPGDETVARFIERSEITRNVISPLGAASEYTEISYTQSEFKISQEWPLLEIRSGFRNSAKLLNHLSMALKFSVTIEDESINISKFLPALKNFVPDFKITALTVRNLQIDASTAIHMEVTSTTNALAKARELIGKRKHELHKVKCEWLADGLDCSVFLTSEGQIAIQAKENSEAFSIIYKCAREATK